jgi:large subunit ribosomal protein L25
MNAQTQTYKLDAVKREILGKKVKSIKKDGLIPAIIYGHGIKNTPIAVNQKIFAKILKEAGSSALVDLKISDKENFKVLIKDTQSNPVNGESVHIDFYKVKMDEKIKTEIPLTFIGESEAVANMDGTLITNKDALEVECLPSDLVSEIIVDISALKTFENQITVADIKLPDGIEMLVDPEEVICFVEEPRSEEELAELEESTVDEEKEAIEQITAEEKQGEEAEGSKAESETEKK